MHRNHRVPRTELPRRAFPLLMAAAGLWFAAVPAACAQAAHRLSDAEVVTLEHLAASDPTAAHRMQLSQAYIDRDELGRAVTVLNALVAEQPRIAMAWNNLCVAYTLQKQLNLAVPACETGVRMDGSIPLLRNNLRWAQDERDRVLAALSEQGKTPAAARNTAFYLDEGMNHLHLGEYDAALADWQRSLELDPRNADAENDIGVVRMLQNRFPEAEAAFRQAIAVAPANQLARNNLAWALETERAALPAKP